MENLTSIKAKSRKRVGRGISSGQGKTAGRGYKGQKSRSGFNLPNRFEGGQTTLSMRLPKLPGFRSCTKQASTFTLDMISKNFKDGETVALASMIEKKMIKAGERVKIVFTGELTKKIKLGEDVKASKTVVALIEKLSAKTEKPEKAESSAPAKEKKVAEVAKKKVATPKVKKATKETK